MEEIKKIDDLKEIKKHYGEKMMHLCRELFPSLLETPGILFKTLSSHFAYNRFLCDDIIEEHKEYEFKNYIYSYIDVEKKDKVENLKSPTELLSEAGYDLFECHSEEEIQSFKKYYVKGEELCTFNGGRLERCHVFFAVKKNVNEIKREKFKNLQRQDEYGTSVISIQFTKGEYNTVSIKNRYNHHVNNPDATFSNNLDNIIQGLTESFEKYYSLNIGMDRENGFELKNYTKVRNINGFKYYKYNIEKNNIYYCPDNIVIADNNVHEYDKSKYLVFENYILSYVDKNIATIKRFKVLNANREIINFPEAFIESIGKIENIKVTNDKESKTKEIVINGDIKIILDEKNCILSYQNEHVTEIGNDFLMYSKEIKELIIPSVKKIGDRCLTYNEKLKNIDVTNALVIGREFLQFNKELEQFNAPNLKVLCGGALTLNTKLNCLNIPKVHTIGSLSFQHNQELEELYLPDVLLIGIRFFQDNEKIKKVYMPNLDYESCYNVLSEHIRNILDENRGAR